MTDYLDITDKVTEANHSSMVMVGYEVDRLFDGDSSTSWECSGGDTFPVWVSVRVPFPRVPIRISIAPRSGLQGRAPKTFVFYGSNTGAFSGEETTLYTSGSETSWGNLEERNFAFTNTDSFTYFKLKILTSNTSNIASMSMLKIEIDASQDNVTLGSDLSGGQTYLQSSYWDANYLGSKAFDNDTATCWHTAGSTNPPHWIQVQFNSAQIINFMAFTPRVSSTWFVPLAFNIKGSNTGSFSGEETTIASFTVANQWLQEFIRYFYFQNTTAYIYYRLTVTQSSGQNSMAAEIEYIFATIPDHTVITLKYRTGATSALCEAATYQEYTVPFDSEGFVQLRVEG